MKISMAGTGYVGLVSAVCFADKGFNVVCVDVDENKINMLNRGVSPIFEPGLEELMAKNSKRLSYTTDYKQAYAESDIIFIGVGTPEKHDGSANLEYVNQVLENVKQCVRKDTIVVIKSTVPIGTNERIKEFFKDSSYKITVVSNPEFLAQGTAVQDTLFPSRIIVGTDSEDAAEVMRKLYINFPAKILFMNNTSAEMVKYSSNDFLALKISFINEIANVCEMVGADIEDVAAGMGLDPRIGNSFLKAGIGYGGSCFPKDTKALHWLANAMGYELKTVRATIEINKQQKIRLLQRVDKYFGSLKGVRVAVLGVTFKPNTDDLREAPSIDNVEYLLSEGAEVVIFDPVGAERFKKLFPCVEIAGSVEAAITGAELCFIFTEWQSITGFDISKYAELMKKPIVLDGRNCYKPSDMSRLGISYESIGRPAKV